MYALTLFVDMGLGSRTVPFRTSSLRIRPSPRKRRGTSSLGRLGLTRRPTRRLHGLWQRILTRTSGTQAKGHFCGSQRSGRRLTATTNKTTTTTTTTTECEEPGADAQGRGMGMSWGQITCSRSSRPRPQLMPMPPPRLRLVSKSS
jgi:hypothetical protein